MVFNQDDVQNVEKVTISSGDILSEGEKNKVIQNPESNVKTIEKLENDPKIPDQPQPEPEKGDTAQEPNTIPFPTASEAESKPKTKTAEDDEDPQEFGHGKRVAAKPKGIYKKMHAGVAAEITHDESLDDENLLTDLLDDHEQTSTDLPPDFALIGGLNFEPTSIDEALRGPDAQKWQEALDYEISQLEKMGTWVVKNLPAGHTAIPCSEVLRIKRGPDGEIQSYRVRIVAGGHRQVEGLNYTETFSAAAKMPTV